MREKAEAKTLVERVVKSFLAFGAKSNFAHSVRPTIGGAWNVCKVTFLRQEREMILQCVQQMLLLRFLYVNICFEYVFVFLYGMLLSGIT